MPEARKPTPLADRLRKHRCGIAYRLEDIQASLNELREDVHAALAARGGEAHHEQQEDRRHA